MKFNGRGRDNIDSLAKNSGVYVRIANEAFIAPTVKIGVRTPGCRRNRNCGGANDEKMN